MKRRLVNRRRLLMLLSAVLCLGLLALATKFQAQSGATNKTTLHLQSPRPQQLDRGALRRVLHVLLTELATLNRLHQRQHQFLRRKHLARLIRAT
jgi:hypothetical protein